MRPRPTPGCVDPDDITFEQKVGKIIKMNDRNRDKFITSDEIKENLKENLDAGTFSTIKFLEKRLGYFATTLSYSVISIYDYSF